MEFGIFKAFRDRTLTKNNTLTNGRIRVLKSRNIGNNTGELIIKDNGVGIKDTDNISKNLGCEIIKSLTKQLGGDVSLIKQENGTAYRLIFPTQMEHTID